jgi:uncharacterized protein (DUF1330 family)
MRESMPAAFIIAQMTIQDQAVFDEYSPLAGASVLKYGGEFVFGGKGPRAMLEGGTQMPFVAIAKFPSYERALEWYHSSDYAPLIKMRSTAAVGTLMIVEGID